MATICTYKNHLPTGSPISTLLSSFVHQKLFDRLFNEAQTAGLRMTVLLDDITFSGKKISRAFRATVRHEIMKALLRAKRRKEKFYHLGATPEITGVVLRKGSLLAPWRRHKALGNAIRMVLEAGSIPEFDRAYAAAISRMSETAYVEKKHSGLKAKLRQYRILRRAELAQGVLGPEIATQISKTTLSHQADAKLIENGGSRGLDER